MVNENKQLKREYPRAKKGEESEVVGILDPLIKEWFFTKFKDLSDSQLYGVMPIHQRRNILVSASTGSGKTLTSFLAINNYLVGLARRNELEDKVYCIYSSPLKALNNDIFVNLENPLSEIYKLAEEKGIVLQKIRVGLRTGDTENKDKVRMLKHPPHIFVEIIHLRNYEGCESYQFFFQCILCSRYYTPPYHLCLEL